MKSFVLFFIALAASFVPAHAVVMELRAEQTVVGANLTLNDLLQSSQGISADDLSAPVGATPSLGNAESWTRDKIEKALSSTLKAQTIEWTGAAACNVKRPSVQMSERDVRTLITAELGKHLPADSDYAILELPGVDPFPIPDGQLETTVELANGALRNEWGEATLQFRYQGELAVTKSVRFHWAYTRLVWQAVNKVGTGDQLDATTFQQVEMNVLKLPGNLQPATDFPDGKVAAHSLPQGKVLMENDWVEPQLVARNDLVTILYEHHGVSITVQAKAMANGVKNQVIAVQNLSSHKIFNARVVEERSLVYDE
jgi:flagellar basal body P-ring formation protein FlgA